MSGKTKPNDAKKPPPIPPPAEPAPAQTDLDRERAAGEGMTEAPPGTQGAKAPPRAGAPGPSEGNKKRSP
jgi:hypothetical protein